MTMNEWEVARREFWERRYADWVKEPHCDAKLAAANSSEDVAEWEKAFPKPIPILRFRSEVSPR